MTPAERDQRNSQIFALHREGHSSKKIGAEFGLTRQRVCEIIRVASKPPRPVKTAPLMKYNRMWNMDEDARRKAIQKRAALGAAAARQSAEAAP